MKLNAYNLLDWKDGKIKRKKKIGDKIILLLSIDRSVGPSIEGRKNLLAINDDDEIIWVADLPTEVYDSYIDMKYMNGIIRAESSNSFVSEIDPNTGIVLKKYMIK